MTDPLANQPPPPPAPSSAVPSAPPLAPPIPPAQPPPPPPQPNTTPQPEGDGTDWKAEARKWESRAKENSDAADRLKEIEDGQKTQQEKLTEQLQAAQMDAVLALQLDVALDKAPAGMDPAQIRKLAKRLTGSTREELEADAEELFADFAGAGTVPSTPPANGGQQTPVEQLRPGALPTTPEPTLPEQIAAAEKAGDWATARQLKSQQLLELQRKSN